MRQTSTHRPRLAVAGALLSLCFAGCQNPPTSDDAAPGSASHEGSPNEPSSTAETPKTPSPASNPDAPPPPQPSMFAEAVGLEGSPTACYDYAAASCRELLPPKPTCVDEIQAVLVKSGIEAGVCEVAHKSLLTIESTDPTVRSSAAAKFLQEALLTSPQVDLAAVRAAQAQAQKQAASGVTP